MLSTEAAAAASGSERCPGGRWAQENQEVSGVRCPRGRLGPRSRGGQSVSQDMRALQVCGSPTLPFVLDLSHRAHWPSFSLSLWPVTTSSLVFEIVVFSYLSCYFGDLWYAFLLCNYIILFFWTLILLWKCRLPHFTK